MMSGKDDKNDQPMVMVIDDDDSTRMMAFEFLTQAGFAVEEAVNGRIAIDTVDDINPDLILLDVEMPELNGFDTCKALRQKGRFAHTPILMLTGLNDNQSIDLAYEAGATDFAMKPINWTLLVYRLRYMQRASQSAEALVRNQTSLAAAQRIAQLGNWEFDFSKGTMEWSDQLYRIFALTPGEIKPSPRELLKFVHPADRDRVADWLKTSRTTQSTTSIDHRIVHKEGKVRSVRQQLEPLFDSDGKLVRLQAVVQDFTERRRAETKIHQLAYYDTLTHLPNRALFNETLESALTRARQNQGQLAVLHLDLDDFKRVNDTFGHAVGDTLLREVGQRLKDNLRTRDAEARSPDVINTIARMGGDEFTILFPTIHNLDDVTAVAERILGVLSQPFRPNGNEVFTTPSVGIAIYPADGQNADELMKNADMAMYEAKRAGKNVYRTHNEDMHAEAQKRYKIEAKMRNALEDNEFAVFFQPQLDLSTGELYSAEALIRWQSEELGFVSPGEFIPIAEENGFIVVLGEWVLRTSCRQAKSWIDSGFDIPAVAVNISVLQFLRADFPDVVASVLEETGLPPEKLELEITESLLASDTHGAVSTLRRLKAIGVQLSIDDFGTGYSSLSQLKNFPIDRLKIDQSFIQNVTESTEDSAITRAVIAMADSMNIRVLAEGVETIEHLEFLRDNNCHEIQGYYISRPMPADKLAESMEELSGRLDELFPNRQAEALRKAS